MKILIISDIHAMSQDLLDLTESTQPKPSMTAKGGYSGTTGGRVRVEDTSLRKNRLLAIPKFLQNEGLSKDIDSLICLGDMAHQCKKSVIQIVWRQLNDIVSDLGIPKIYGVTGNHDVAARAVDFENGVPNSILKQLRPSFPSNMEEHCESYHNETFAFIEESEIGIVLIDTSSLLGYVGKKQSDLWNKGFISDGVVASIEMKIKASNCSAFIIAMHHHPTRVHSQQDVETDYIENGDNFLKALQDTGKPCFVLHGHKHFVSFRKYNVTANSPWILSASSLAAKSYPNMDEGYKCQFHILDVEMDTGNNAIFGQVASWDWVTNQWQKASSTGMTHLIGFGRQESISLLAGSIFSKVEHGGSLTGKAAFAAVPELKRLTPDDINELKQRLKSAYSVEMIADSGVEKFAFYVEDI